MYGQLVMEEILREPTYVEREVGIRGLVTGKRRSMETEVTIMVNGEERKFSCGCPAFPTIKSLGCPLHACGPYGGSWPVVLLKEELGQVTV